MGRKLWTSIDCIAWISIVLTLTHPISTFIPSIKSVMLMKHPYVDTAFKHKEIQWRQSRWQAINEQSQSSCSTVLSVRCCNTSKLDSRFRTEEQLWLWIKHFLFTTFGASTKQQKKTKLREMERKECIHDGGCHLASMTRGMDLNGTGWSCRLCPKEPCLE